MTFDAEIQRMAGRLDEGLAFEGSSWTFDEIHREVGRRQAVIDAVDGDPSRLHLGILAHNTPEMYFWLLAALGRGVTVVGLNDTRSAPDIARDANHTQCDLVIVDHQSDLSDDVGRLLEVPWLRCEEATADRVGSMVRVADKDESRVDDLALLIFTSGTTSAPKAAMRSYPRLRDIGTGVATQREITSRDRLYSAMPWYHSNAFYITIIPALLSGAAVILKRRFSASTFMSDIRQYRATGFNYVGKPLQYILAQPVAPGERDHHLRYGMGNEANVKDIEAFRERFGVSIIDGFGSTEGGLVAYRSDDMPPGSIGRDPEGTVRILDPATGLECPPARFDDRGRILNPDEAIGEMVNTAGAGLFEGYYRNAEANAQRVAGGQYWSGDLGYRDQAGFLFFAGRSGEWLRVDGENFAVFPLEQVLMRHEGVAGVAVYAVPDPHVGDQVMAALQLAPGWTFDALQFSAFLDAQDDLGSKWRPRFVRIVDPMPMSHTNKVDKRSLQREQFFVPDEVYVRTGDGYQRLDDEARDELVREYETNGRGDVLNPSSGASA